MNVEIHKNKGTKQKHDQVVVIGAGIAGSTAALELARHGQRVRLYERRKLSNGVYPGQERSELTLTEAVDAMCATSAITTPLTRVEFVSLDNKLQFGYDILPVSNYCEPVVGIDHRKVLSALYDQINRTPSIEFNDKTSVSAIREIDGENGVYVTIDGHEERVKAVVNAVGPSWHSLPYTNPRRQQEYENSVVAFAYGRKCKGRILRPDGDKMLMHPVSVNDSGRTSWVSACGNNEIEVVYSDYATRRYVGLVNRKHGYGLLKNILVTEGYIEIEEEGPVISGFFGLEARRRPSGDRHIFHHGERGQYNAATVGDAIAPTVRLAPILAEIIANDGTADDYFRKTNKTFNHRYELATTKARMKSKSVGGGFAMLDIVNSMTPAEQERLLKYHTLPWHLIPKIIYNHPNSIRTFVAIAREYIKDTIRARRV